MSNISTTDVNQYLGKTTAKTNSTAIETSALGAASNSGANTSATTTSRGTKITTSDQSFDKNSFLKILSAQLSNLDPSSNQDSTAYVTQMAQFASMEQMQNLNNTMSESSVRNLLGKQVVVDVTDSHGDRYVGTVNSVSRSNGKNYIRLNIVENGQLKELDKNIDADKILSVVKDTDSTSTVTAINSQFLAASSLNNKRVIVADKDSSNKDILVKGTVEGAYISGADVKLRVKVLDDNLNSTGETKVYSYSDIVRAGDLNDEDMKLTIDQVLKENGITTSSTSTTNAGDSSTSTNTSSSNDTGSSSSNNSSTNS
ncbi:flagellar hook capping FlgD N-terminal domain-containing protein [Clostridium saccharobutylicum]|uniref:Basal-body rod modification protein FlgD n=1 Tax=Clostridium saccharobutylicum TaxID=169679 RepID=A0A1S8NIG3_CLOSA|nr:flagellar hook capping FlgD N-terminal domain-containing protein [Clostridium saccharobutylicum]OOM16237.1 flagellar basal body rod modification protein [Clostridium saccharobutylicum]